MPKPVPIGSFNHATLNCRDVVRSVAFYCQVLGFQEAARPGFSFAGAWLYRDGLGMMLHLNEDPTLEARLEDPINTRRAHLAFHAHDFDEAVGLLTERGMRVALRTLPDYGYRQVFFQDPDGNLIELGEWPSADALAKPKP